MKKLLTDLTKHEFELLKNIGLLWELYPDAPDVYERISSSDEDYYHVINKKD